jgi:hypothetical protein
MMQKSRLDRAPVVCKTAREKREFAPRGGTRPLGPELPPLPPEDAASSVALLLEFLRGCSSGGGAAIGELLHSLSYAQQLDLNEWDFAVDLSTFHRLKLSDNDLRWLVYTGFVHHAIETRSPDDFSRQFVSSKTLSLTRKSCFVLTEKGAMASRAILDQCAAVPRVISRVFTKNVHDSSLAKVRPQWDRDRQQLRLGSTVIKEFKVPAASQEMVLEAFEEKDWPPRIDDPLPPHRNVPQKRRLQETIRSLNRNQKQPLIRFLGDGSAKGVLWTLVSPSPVREQL